MDPNDLPGSRRRFLQGAAATVAVGLVAPAMAQSQSGSAAAPVALKDPRTSYPRPPFKPQSQPRPGLAGQMTPRPDHGEARPPAGAGSLEMGLCKLPWQLCELPIGPRPPCICVL